MRKGYIYLIFTLFTSNIWAQSSPTPFDLGTGNFSFTHWDSLTNAAGTYPSNMIFHTVSQQSPDENTPANGDWNCAYNLTTGCYFKGRDTLGVSIRNIGNPQSANCMVNGTGAIYVGDATVGLNTTNRENVTVSWVGRMISSFNYDTAAQVTRFWGIACQYRTGDTGVFTNVPGNYLFKCNLDSVTYRPQFSSDTLNTVLPSSCNNLPVVQVRWIYHQLSSANGGPRPELAVDDINVTSTSIPTSLKKINIINNKTLSVYPNPVSQGNITLSKNCNFAVYDILGHQLSRLQTARDYNTDNLPKGVYFVRTSEGETVRFIKQ